MQQLPELEENDVIYIIPEYPSFSEVFIHNEIEGLRRAGIKISVLALKKGPALPGIKNNDIIYDAPFLSIDKINAHFLIITRNADRYFKTLVAELKLCSVSITNVLRAIRNFSTSVYFFSRIQTQNFRHIHAHFISLPTTIGRMLACLTGKELSCTAHANDIYTSPLPELALNLRQASVVITCTRYNQLYLQKLVDDKTSSTPIIHIYHGLDLRKWNRQTPIRPCSLNKMHVLSIGRLVDKKGLIFLLEALFILQKEGLNVTCDIIGDGPRYNEYKEFICNAGIASVVTLHGAITPTEIKKFYERADVFILPCIIAANGDRDGLPNVLLEAMAMQIPVITTAVSAITELVKDGVTGTIVEEKSAVSIVQAIKLLLSAPDHRRQLVAHARMEVERYDIANSTSRLKEIFTRK